jgi:hypothetical protein
MSRAAWEFVTGPALGEAAGPAFPRTLGVGAEAERLMPNMPLGNQQTMFMQRATGTPGWDMYPGYPQDMFMPTEQAAPVRRSN